jgi:hypothetical protein
LGVVLVRVACVVLVIAVAGCSSPDEAEGEEPLTPPIDDRVDAGPALTEVDPGPSTRRLDWNGTLVLGAWVCEFTVTQQCRWQPDGAFGQSHAFEGLLGNVTGGELRVEWTVATPLTQELVLDAGVFTPDCADCNHTMVGSVAGPSPLVLPLPTGLRFVAGEVLGIGVYSNQYTAADQGAAGTSGDQDFRVSGDVVLAA